MTMPLKTTPARPDNKITASNVFIAPDRYTKKATTTMYKYDGNQVDLMIMFIIKPKPNANTKNNGMDTIN